MDHGKTVMIFVNHGKPTIVSIAGNNYIEVFKIDPDLKRNFQLYQQTYYTCQILNLFGKTQFHRTAGEQND